MKQKEKEHHRRRSPHHTLQVYVDGDFKALLLDSSYKTAENASFVTVLYFLQFLLPLCMCITLFLFYVCVGWCGFLYLYLKTSDCYSKEVVELGIVEKRRLHTF